MNPTVVYLILSHRLPEQLQRLVAVLRSGSPRAEIVVHHNAVLAAADRAALIALGVHLIEPPTDIEWAGPSSLEAVLRCLDWIHARLGYDWLVLISGQDYPVRPLAEIESGLAGCGFDALIEANPCPLPPPGPVSEEFAQRYHHRWHRSSVAIAPRLAGAVTGRSGGRVLFRRLPTGDFIGRRVRRSPFTPGYVCHFGSDWFSLSRRAVDVLAGVRAGSRGALLLDHFRHTIAPTEGFVQTVLANEPALKLSPRVGRYVAFDLAVNRFNPKVLGIGDLEAITASGASFARKFDVGVDADVLDLIDARVHGSALG